MNKQLVIFGTGEMAMLARFYFQHDGGRNAAAFVVDDEFAQEDQIEGLPVVPWSEALGRYDAANHEFFVALGFAGLNSLRQRKYEACRAAGYTLASYVSTKAITWPDLSHGQNCMILELTSVNPTVRIGNNVIIWSCNSLGHGSTIGDHVYIASLVCLGGNAHIGNNSFLGIHSSVRDHCTVGAETFVAMGACVARDLPPRSVVLGAKSTIADPPTAEFVRLRHFPPI